MRISLRIDVFKLHLNFILILIWVKLLFSYLSVELSYFQRHLTPNSENFNFLKLPSDFSNRIEFVLLPLLLLFVLRNYKYLGRCRELIDLSFIMFFSAVISGLINSKPLLDSLMNSFKIFTPIYLFCALIVYNKRTGDDLKSILSKTIKLCLILTVVALIFFNPSYNRLEYYLPIYFGGIHTHNYILSAVFIAITYMLYERKKKYLLIVFMLASFTFMYFGYNVRTASIVYLIFILTVLFLRSSIFKALLLKILIFTPLIILFFLLLFDINSWSDFTSGRTSMYIEKLNTLRSYSFMEWLFGKGHGSDLVSTNVWWWSKKGSHSDIITFIIENGFVYLSFFVLLFARLITLSTKLNLLYFAIIFGLLISSTISNGILVRPTAGYVVFIVLAYIYINTHHEVKKLRQDKLTVHD